MWRRAMPCVLLLSTACAEYDLPAQQISRLTIDLISTVAELLAKDDNCGFESPQVKAAQHVEGEAGQGGVVIRTVEETSPARWKKRR
jgi:hypothetical protein